ncbi:MAG: aldehyde dehydrogenase family protein, partial [Solirubrobacterales bacterium]
MATATAKKTEVLELKNMIGGKFTDAAEGETEDILNPATGEVIAHAPLSTEKDVDKAVKAARKAFETWQNTTPAERSALLLKLADAFEERAEEITDLETIDAGKPRAAMFEEEIPPMVDQLRFFAGAARTMEGRAAGEYMEGHTSFIRREPIGVCGQITPWNYPLMMAVWKIGPALATGNTLVLKPAETTPVTTLKVLAETCAEIFPPGVANFIAGHGEPAGASLVTHPEVDMVSLTGSPGTGKWIAKAASDTLKRVHLELGGKAPVVVFDDVDMETAMETIAGTGYFNAGQDCTAATRVLAGKGVYD